jgi:hypothetical protein
VTQLRKADAFLELFAGPVGNGEANNHAVARGIDYRPERTPAFGLLDNVDDGTTEVVSVGAD